ncbi:MAG: CBS domain-containing protein [Nocardioides sp.]
MYARPAHRVRTTDPLRRVMVWPVAVVEAEATLTEVAEALAADEIGALCVTENGVLAGIVSERDVVAHVAAGGDPENLTAADVMSTDLVTLTPDDTVLDAAKRMKDSQIRHLPVLLDDDIAGIVSMRDLFDALVDAG